MSEELLPIRSNRDFTGFLVGGVGLMALLGMTLWYTSSGSQILEADLSKDDGNVRDTTPLGTPELSSGQEFSPTDAMRERGGSDDIFDQTYYGYAVLCGILNTDVYGNGQSVDRNKPIFDSASDVFDAMGTRVHQDGKVMVVKGQEITFRDAKTGVQYTIDANGTMYCLAEK